MFAANNRVKRRPSPYEMEITDGEFLPHLCYLPLLLVRASRRRDHGDYSSVSHMDGEVAMGPQTAGSCLAAELGLEKRGRGSEDML